MAVGVKRTQIHGFDAVVAGTPQGEGLRMDPNTPMVVEHFQQAICATLTGAGFAIGIAVRVGWWLNRRFMRQLEADRRWEQEQAKGWDALDLKPWRRRAKRWASTSGVHEESEACSSGIEHSELFCRSLPTFPLRFLRFGLPLTIGAPVHALRLRREGIRRARMTAQAQTDLVPTTQAPVTPILLLARINQSIAVPTEEVAASPIEDRHLPPTAAPRDHARADKPRALPAVMTRGPSQ
jgi:hypothetical protein